MMIISTPKQNISQKEKICNFILIVNEQEKQKNAVSISIVWYWLITNTQVNISIN